MDNFGLQYGDGNVCKFSDSDHTLSLTKGRLPDEGELPNVSALQTQPSNYLEISANDGFSIRFTIAEIRIFGSYAKLKTMSGPSTTLSASKSPVAAEAILIHTYLISTTL